MGQLSVKGCITMEKLSKEEFLQLLKEADRNKTIHDEDWLNGYGDPWDGYKTYKEVEKEFAIKDNECIYLEAKEVDEIYSRYLDAVKNLKEGYDRVALRGREDSDGETVCFYFKKNKLKKMKIEIVFEYTYKVSSFTYYFNR